MQSQLRSHSKKLNILTKTIKSTHFLLHYAVILLFFLCHNYVHMCEELEREYTSHAVWRQVKQFFHTVHFCLNFVIYDNNQYQEWKGEGERDGDGGGSEGDVPRSAASIGGAVEHTQDVPRLVIRGFKAEISKVCTNRDQKLFELHFVFSQAFIDSLLNLSPVKRIYHVWKINMLHA